MKIATLVMAALAALTQYSGLALAYYWWGPREAIWIALHLSLATANLLGGVLISRHPRWSVASLTLASLGNFYVFMRLTRFNEVAATLLLLTVAAWTLAVVTWLRGRRVIPNQR